MDNQPVILCLPCAVEESSIDSNIDSQTINNIVRFLSNTMKKTTVRCVIID